jgi:hypothetical protein
LTLGLYKGFPASIHRIDTFSSTISNKQIQQKLINVFNDVNQKEFTFEEVTNPTVPDGKVIFEFGIAEAMNFNFIDGKELERTLELLEKQRVHSLDFFCSIRYYKEEGTNKNPLKFDYFLIRTIFNKNKLEIHVFHERGPRYISPEELTTFIFEKINELSTKSRKILKRTDR